MQCAISKIHIKWKDKRYLLGQHYSISVKQSDFGQSSCFSWMFIGMCFDSQTEIPGIFFFWEQQSTIPELGRNCTNNWNMFLFGLFVCFPVCKSIWKYRFVCQQAHRTFDRLLLHTVIITFPITKQLFKIICLQKRNILYFTQQSCIVKAGLKQPKHLEESNTALPFQRARK